jgi:hypothetical protein
MALLSYLTLGLAWNEWLIVIFAGHLAYWIGWVIYARFLHPLAKVPGPLWPSISRTWLMYRMYKGDLEFHMRAIHNGYKPSLRQMTVLTLAQ